MTITAEVFWWSFLASLPSDQLRPDTYQTWAFGDNPEMTEELAALVLLGLKTATASLVWTYEAENEPLPQVGDYSLILDGNGEPVCIIQTTAVTVIPFKQVYESQAWFEGEGDRSLAFWRDAHWRFFSRECERIGRQPDIHMPVCCERFRLLFPFDPVVRHIVDWAGARDDIRLVIWTSSRAGNRAPVDAFSDYDIILGLKDIHQFYESRDWLEEFGPVLVLWREKIFQTYGLDRTCFVTQYEDGLKIDWSLWTEGLVAKLIEREELTDDLDVGYRVLLDKDGQTVGLKPPSHRAHIPLAPTEEEYLTAIETFFHDATYTAKHIWRDELLPTKFNLNDAANNFLRQMLEWWVETQQDWSLRPGAYGRNLKQYLPADWWVDLEAIFVGPSEIDNWQALYRMFDLMRKASREVGEALGYPYPEELHKRMLAYMVRVRELERGSKNFPPDWKAPLLPDDQRRG